MSIRDAVASSDLFALGSDTPRLKAGACASKPGSDQSQPGSSDYRAALEANTTIGTVGWHLSLTLCGQQLNRRTGFEPVLLSKKPPTNFVEGNMTWES